MTEMKDNQPSAQRKAERDDEALMLQGRLALAILTDKHVSKWAETNKVEADHLLSVCSHSELHDIHGIVKSLIRWGDLSDRQLDYVRRCIRITPV